jgi:hypothetical protein
LLWLTVLRKRVAIRQSLSRIAIVHRSADQHRLTPRSGEVRAGLDSESNVIPTDLPRVRERHIFRGNGVHHVVLGAGDDWDR